MTASFIGPIILLSFIKHQEPRFLIPIILPLVFLHSQRLQNPDTKNKIIDKKKSVLLKMWYTFNIICVIFYGFVHQAGVYPLADYISNALTLKPKQSSIHLVTSHVFMFPESLLLIPDSKRLRKNYDTGQKYRLARQFYAYEMGSQSLDKVFDKISTLYNVSQIKYEKTNIYNIIYVAIPSSLINPLQDLIKSKSNVSFVLNEMKCFYPHISVEALPSLSIYEKCSSQYEYCMIDNFTKSPQKFFSDFISQIGLTLYRVQKRT